MDRISKYKMKYGDGEITCDDNGRVELPKWFCRFLLDHAGCKSKKSRQRNKIIKREFHKAIWRGISTDTNFNETTRLKYLAKSKLKEPTR